MHLAHLPDGAASVASAGSFCNTELPTPCGFRTVVSVVDHGSSTWSVTLDCGHTKKVAGRTVPTRSHCAGRNGWTATLRRSKEPPSEFLDALRASKGMSLGAAAILGVSAQHVRKVIADYGLQAFRDEIKLAAKPLPVVAAPPIRLPKTVVVPRVDGACDVPLTRGAVAVISPEDAEAVAEFKWHATSHGYASTRGIGYLHRFLMRNVLSRLPTMTVDHINGDKLDNRRENLRLATQAQNTHNRRHGGLKGFQKTERSDRWSSGINHYGKRIALGRFDSPEGATAAYKRASAELRGEFDRGAVRGGAK